MKSEHPLVIAVDGYSSCGKSTFARLIAKELNFIYIDSGAMYRTVALYGLMNGIAGRSFIDKERLTCGLDEIKITFRLNAASGLQETWLNGKNIERDIRGIEVSRIVSKISQISEVRSKMVSIQRSMGVSGKVVMDGRDIGSTVFPDATLKIFMTADIQVRAERRYKELVEKKMTASLQDITENIKMRDYEDENRVESPLRKADDAVILDNSQMTIEEQMIWFREMWNFILQKHENRN